MKQALLLSALLVTSYSSHATEQKKWVTAYYASWQESGYPLNRIDYTALTHIVLAHWMTNTDGTVRSSDWDANCGRIVENAHRFGVKVLMMLGGSDDFTFASAALSSRRAQLISSVQSKISGCRLDGVDLDWEAHVDEDDLVSLARDLRAASPNYIITVPIDASVQSSSLAVRLSAFCDQVNMMTYGNAHAGYRWSSWYFSALAGDGFRRPSSVTKYVKAWEAAGMPAGKIGVGIGFYMTGWAPPINGPLQTSWRATVPVQNFPYGWPLAIGGGVLSCYYNQPTGTYQYDPSPQLNTDISSPPQQPSISFKSTFRPPRPCPASTISWITYEDEASVAAKADYIMKQGLGGAMLWTVQSGATDPVIGRNPLLDVIKLKLLRSGPAPMPMLKTKIAAVAGPTAITLAGLPEALKQVEVAWSDGNTAFDLLTDHFSSYGQPSQYYIEASSDGKSWTVLSHINDEHYNGRQFVYDWTGSKYIFLRMRIVSTIGSNAGRIRLAIHDAVSNATDTYLLLGDSVTVNCWSVANGGFPAEPLGAQIHAARRQRFPVHTEGGQPSSTSATPLESSVYGRPTIQQWLMDFPAVKFVGLSFGSSDANGAVPAGEYCANMKAMIQYVIAAGKVPIVPTIVASPSAAIRANAPALNSCLETLLSNYPATLQGPDLWQLFAAHDQSDTWFMDSMHPSLTVGCQHFRDAWTTMLLSTIYPDVPPDSIARQ